MDRATLTKRPSSVKKPSTRTSITDYADKVQNRSSSISAPAEDVIFLRLPDVRAVTGLSKTSLYALIREKDFPAPVRLGPRAVAWVRSEVRQWAAERVNASRSIA